MEQNVLDIEGLSKSFGKNKVLKDINIHVKPGSIMGLMGENGAGKSTLMKCLFGIYGRDNGTILLNGEAVSFSNPREALEQGIAMVHQELNQCLDRTILDNMFLGRYIGPAFLVNESLMLEKCKQIFADLDMNFNPKTIMRTMSVSQRQMVEIAKAISYNAKVIVLDEPTSSLSEREVKKLFHIIKDLKEKKNVSFIFISHKMDEIFDLCDDIVILRDGLVTLDKKVCDTNLDELVSAMVGRSLDNRFPPLTNTPGECVLKVDGLSTRFSPKLEKISFDLKKGEILGIYGLVGAGRSELLEALFGVRTVSEGIITYNGQRLLFKNSKEAMDNNFAFITEERKLNGMYGIDDLTFNTVITNLDKYTKYGIFSKNKAIESSKESVKKMHVKCTGVNDRISALSGGNQQKVIVGKWLDRSPDIFLMDEPTRGIDILAKYQIYELMIELANQGKSIIMVSSEMPEILGVTNRIAVMSNYKLAGIVDSKETNQEELLRLCAKYL